MRATPIAIVIAAIIIAGAVLWSHTRYEVAGNPDGFVRLDTWSGELDVCTPANSVAGLILSCAPIQAK